MNLNRELLSLEKDNDFRRLQELTWLPWVGVNYFHARRRVLIVAESHYNKGENIDHKQSQTIQDENVTRKVVQYYPVSHEESNPMFENLHRCLFQTNNIDRETIWKNIAFYNFIQRPMDYNGNEWEKERPNGNDLQIGWKVFIEVIKLLRPTDCIFVGVAAADAFNENMNKLGIEYKSTEWQKVEHCKHYARKFSIILDDYTLKCIAIQHTSHHFSWKAWNAYLDKENPKMMKDLYRYAKISTIDTKEDKEYIVKEATNTPPYWLKHKPIYSCDYSQVSPNSDLKYITVGRAQWDNKDSVSIKSFRESNGHYSRMSEEIPLTRLPEMTLMLLSAIRATQLRRENKSTSPTYLKETFVSEEAEFLDSQFNNHAESLHKSLTELKHLLNEIDLENI